MRNPTNIFTFCLFPLVTALLILSCTKDDDAVFSQENTQISNNETFQESTTDELDDIASFVLNSEEGASGGRIRQTEDDRFECDGTTIVFSNVASDRSSGTATINFGLEGCTDNRGNIRKGIIIVSWSGGRWYTVGSTHTIELNNYSMNGVSIGGTRILTCSVASGNLTSFSIRWDLTANHSITWPDGTTGIRVVNKSKQWEHSPGEDLIFISNGPGAEYAAEGTNRYNNPYNMSIIEPLKYVLSCSRANKVYIPVQGIKVFTQIDKQKSYSIDFGDGSCDNTFTVTVDGRSKTITAKNDSGN